MYTTQLVKSLDPRLSSPGRIPSVGIVCCIALLIIVGCATTTYDKASESTFSETKELKVTEYILGAGDKVEISVYRHDELSKTFSISPSGRIMYPLIGDIQVAGLSIFLLRDNIRDALSKYIINPQVVVNVTSFQSQKVFVLGEVNNPGIFTMDTPMNVIEVIARAGGFTHDANKGSILLVRGELDNPELTCLDIKNFLKKGGRIQNVSLRKGDIVYVSTTTIANVSRFFRHLNTIIRPITELQRGIILGDEINDIVEGKNDRRVFIGGGSQPE